jgi:hypothetical protein
MRIVLDTNVLARAFGNTTGPAAALLQMLRVTNHELILSTHILSEVDRVLRYKRLRRRHGRHDPDIDVYLDLLRTIGITVEPLPLTAVPDDPDDDAVVGTALSGKADVLCTLDRHIRRPEVMEFLAAHGVRVLTDVELLAELRQ